MQTRQAKTQNPKPATESAELTKKTASSAADSARLPSWTNAWGDQPPAALISPVADLQAKHLLSQPEDPDERQAGHIANHVMDMAASSLSLPAAPPDHPGALPPVAASLSHVPPIIQRAPLDDSTVSIPTTASPATAPETASPALIVDDTAEQLAPGQMKKSAFLTQLRPAVCTTSEEALKGTIWSAAGCPWIDHWFGYYSNRDSQQIERALRRYAPEAAKVSSASDYIPIICERVRRGIGQWSSTGEIPGLPEGMDLPDMGIMGLAGSVASGIVSVGSSIASRVGNLLSKGREGGAREASNPQAIQGQLGAGRSLDGGVRSQMEPAFGADFSHVRIHTDATAAGLSDSLNARAFTVGHDVAFRPGEYRPGTLIGDALIAHELAHVVQQGSVNTSSEPLQKGGAEYNSLEEDADVSAVGAMASMWSGTKGVVANVAQNALPNLRSGLRLQRCATSSPKVAPVPSKTVAQPPTQEAKNRGTEEIPELGIRKQEILKQGANVLDLAVAMAETKTLTADYPFGDVYPDGRPKIDDAANFGIFKQNWQMIRESVPQFKKFTAKDYKEGAVLNSDLGLDIQVLHASQKFYGIDQWFAGHRNGPSGLTNPNTADINNYKQAIYWTRDQLSSDEKYLKDDTRFWVYVPPI